MKKSLLNQNAKKVDIFLKRYFNKQPSSKLIFPMQYGSLGGGKKIRSSIILATGKLFNVDQNKLLNICAAVECIHSYSLIHDDLPCMDDDKIRRGKAATHIKFGESTAILAGNSLLTLAFEMIVDKNYKINNILEKLENNETNLSESTDDYQKLIHLNKLLEVHFRKRAKEISAIGKNKSKE